MTETTVTIERPLAAPTPPATAPSKPGPAPAAPSTDKATTAKPGPETTQESADLDSAFTKYEERFGKKPEAKPDEGKDAKADKKAEPAKPAQPADKAKDDRQIQEGPKVLREQLSKTSKERDELSKSIGELKSKITEYEAKGKDTTALTDQLAAERKEKEQLQSQMRALKQEASPEFKDKWDRPFERMVGHAMNDLKSLAVLGESDPETGERKSPDRPAQWDDFQLLYTMPLNKAIGASRKMFSPEDSSIVEYHLQTLKRFDLQRGEALEEEKAKWKENETRELAQQAEHRENFTKASAKARQDLISEHPDWYDEDPEDPDGNELLKLGRDYLAYQPKTPAEAARTYERNKLNAEALPRMADRLEKAKARIAELEAQVGEFKNSSPGSTKRSSQAAPTGQPKSVETEMREAFDNA